ncbi:MAG: methylated-DNA--[protein]-cysteine S-methyltransferase [Pseudobdellovibrionaceae bacterium]
MNKSQYCFQSKIGPLFLVASVEGLEGVYWDEQLIPMISTLEALDTETQILKQAASQLAEYLDGKRKEFDLPLAAFGTEFQHLVWNELKKIPYGKTFSYSEIAQRLKNEKAVRAVGTANGKNPLCIIVPCHRVISADGSLGGYSGGLQIKSQLLEIESRHH